MKLNSKKQVAMTSVLLAVFAALMIIELLPSWNAFIVSPDSSDYVKPWEYDSIRPPIYPWFTALVNGFSQYIEPSSYPQNKLITIDSGTNYLLTIAQAQKLVLVIAYLVLASVVAAKGAPLLGPLFFILYWHRDYQTSFTSHILAECLTESLILFLIAVFLTCVQTPKKRHLYSMAVICALIFLTRPGAAYVGALFLSGICFVIVQRFKEYWIPSLISIGLAAVIALWVPVYSYTQTGYFSVSGMSDPQKLGFAIQYVDKSDRDLMPNSISRNFLDLVVDARDKAQLASANSRSRYQVPVSEFLARNIYTIGLPIARGVGGKKYGELITQFNSIVLDKYRLQHVKTVFASLLSSLKEIRPKGGKLYLFYVIGIAWLFLARREKNSYIALAIILTQVMGLLLMSYWGMPSARYINALNIFGLLPICFIFLSIKDMVWVFLRKHNVDKTNLRASEDEGS